MRVASGAGSGYVSVVRLIAPHLPEGTAASPDSIRTTLDDREGQAGSLLTLHAEEDRASFMEVVGTDGGYILEYQEGSPGARFHSASTLTRVEVEDALNRYAAGDGAWRDVASFARIESVDPWYRAGKQLGKMFGTASRSVHRLVDQGKAGYRDSRKD